MLVYPRCGIEREREERERGGVERGLGGQRRISGSGFFFPLFFLFWLHEDQIIIVLWIFFMRVICIHTQNIAFFHLDEAPYFQSKCPGCRKYRVEYALPYRVLQQIKSKIDCFSAHTHIT